MPSYEQKKISVVIPTYNLKDVLLECLESVLAQDHKNLEVIVIDNGSTDGTSEAVKNNFPGIKLITHQENLGVTGGANAGVRAATGDYIWFVDHDNIFPENTLSELIKLAETDSKIGVTVPKIYYWHDKTMIWAAGTGMNVWTGENIFRGGKEVGQYDKIEEVEIAPANFLVKRKVIEKVGSYDDVYNISYEDADLSYRIKKAGYKTMYVPTAVAFHKIPLLDFAAMKKRWLARSYWTARNKIIFMRKHSPHFYLFVLLYPIWFFVYTYQAIRYWDIPALRNFYKGMVAGYRWSLFEYNKRNERK